MTLTAAFNHACLEDLGHIAPEAAAARLVQVARCAEVIRRGRAGLPIRVSRDLPQTRVGGSERFDVWANRNRSYGRFTDALTLLLGALSGPFVSDLDVSGPEPVSTQPALDDLRGDLFELIWLLLHHGLSTQNSLWLLSLPPDGGLSAPEYVGRAAAAVACLQNLRSFPEVDAADRSLAAAQIGTYTAVLASIEGRFPRIVVLDKAHRGIGQFTPDCSVDVLRAMFEAFDAFGARLDAGGSEEEAMREFKLASTVEISHESRKALATPSLRVLREARVEGGTEAFSLHAKPGYSMRVYIHCRKEPHPTAPGRSWTRIYVGYCGKHLRTE